MSASKRSLGLPANSGAAIVMIENAGDDAVAIFGTTSDHETVYKYLLRLVHPDQFPAGPERNRADRVAAKLGQLYATVTAAPLSAVLLGKWVVERPLAKGDLADLHLVTSDKNGDGVLKIARSEADNDLMDAEAQALKALWQAEPADYHKYLPELKDTFQASGRRVNVFARYPGYYSLREIRGLLPGGVDFRHVVWMMNRLLSLIGFSERAGYVHGGITPDHLLYHPVSHGLILVGWCSAVSINDAEFVPIVSKEWLEANIYPEEVLRKWKAGAGTNVFMAAKSLIWAANKIPHRFGRLFGWCTAGSPTQRPHDAWDLQDMWRGLAEQEYGPAKYLELKLPKSV